VRASLSLLLVGLAISTAQAHLCNNIYRTPDRIIVKPEKDTATLETNDSVRIFVRNNYPTRLRNVSLQGRVDAPGVQATVTPDRIAVMKPGQTELFTVQIAAGPGAARGHHSLKLAISADSIGWDNVGSQPVGEVSDDDLLRALKDNNPSCQVLAAESLARRDHSAGLQALEGMIRRGDRRAIRAAGRSGNPKVLPFLLPKLADRNGFVVGTTCIALGLLKTELDSVRQCCSSADAFVATAAYAALVLAGQGDDAALGYLRQRLNDNDQWVRCAAAWGCAWANEAEALTALDAVFGLNDAELVVFAGDALLSLADRQEGQTAQQAPPVQVTPRDTATSEPVFSAATADRLALKPSLPMPNCAGGGRVELQIYHSYPGPLHNLRVEARGEGVTMGQPATLQMLKPTQIAAVSLDLQATAPEGVDSVPVELTVTAEELQQPGRFTISVPCSDQGVEQVAMDGATPVGEVGVRVVRFGDYHLLLFGIPLVLVLGVLAWRWWRQRRP
jgi:hypothetical protein